MDNDNLKKVCSWLNNYSNRLLMMKSDLLYNNPFLYTVAFWLAVYTLIRLSISVNLPNIINYIILIESVIEYIGVFFVTIIRAIKIRKIKGENNEYN